MPDENQELSVVERARINERRASAARWNRLADDIWDRTIWPTITRTIIDLVNDGLNAIFREPSYRRDTDRYSRRDGRTPYRDYYDKGRDRDERDREDRRELDTFDDIDYESFGVAERTLYDLQEILDRDGKVTVGIMIDRRNSNSDLPKKYTRSTYYDYGWKDLDGVHPVRRGRGDYYVLSLPPAQFLGGR